MMNKYITNSNYSTLNSDYLKIVIHCCNLKMIEEYVWPGTCQALRDQSYNLSLHLKSGNLFCGVGWGWRVRAGVRI